MRTLKNQKKFYYFFVMITFQTLIAQSPKSTIQLAVPLTMSDGIALNLEQDIALMSEKIALLNTQKSSYLEKIGNKTIKLSDIMNILLIISESIQEESPPLAGLAHEFLHLLPQEVSEQLNEMFEESKNLYSDIFNTGTHTHQKGLEVASQVKNSYIHQANSVIKKYEEWLMETKVSYELKLQTMSSL